MSRKLKRKLKRDCSTCKYYRETWEENVSKCRYELECYKYSKWTAKEDAE